MTNCTIENDKLKITISQQGAELSSVFDKETQKERMWCADPAVWNRHAPVLFPFVGKLNDNKFCYNNGEYVVNSQHGFARDMDFECIENESDKTTHMLKSSYKTKECYPFDFELYISHILDKSNPRLLHVLWKIKNTGHSPMFYSIGAHPGFTVPSSPQEKRSDYYIEFPGHDRLTYILLNKSNSLAVRDKSYSLTLDNGFLPIRDDLFDDDALVFDKQNIDIMRIAKPDKSPYVTVSCQGFPYAGVWSKPDGQFICLEPWYGRTDNDGFTGELSDKEGILSLAPLGEHNLEYTIEFHK